MNDNIITVHELIIKLEDFLREYPDAKVFLPDKEGEPGYPILRSTEFSVYNTETHGKVVVL